MMLPRSLGCVVLAFTLLVAGSHGAGDKKDGDKEERKDPAKDPRAVKGKVTGVDLKGAAFTIELAKDKTQSFKVTRDTLFLGPRGGMGEGLTDDRMAKGYEIIVIPTKDGATALEVHLPYRKAPEEKKKTPTKEKTKEKKKAA